MAVRPLRPATDRRLGEPLPHQLANRTRAPLQAPGLAIPGFDLRLSKGRMSCGISVPFETLSPTQRQVTHVLLTRLPLSYPLRGNRVRLACVRHAASVDSEPGSNSHVRWFASRAGSQPLRTEIPTRSDSTNTRPVMALALSPMPALSMFRSRRHQAYCQVWMTGLGRPPRSGVTGAEPSNQTATR